MLIDQLAWNGVNSLLDKYMGLSSDDEVIIAYTPDCQEYAAWVMVAVKQRGVSAKLLWMTPLKDLEFENRLISVLPDANDFAGRLFVLTFERDTMSHGTTLRRILNKYDEKRVVVFRTTGAGIEFFSTALTVSPEYLSAVNATILTRLHSAKKLRIKTKNGTDLLVEIDSKRYVWISNRGIHQTGRFVILPAGEVATYPAKIEGTLVADFAFNVNISTDQDVRLANHPVTVLIKDSKALHFECEDKSIKEFVGNCFSRQNGRNVGELGFGTNSGIVEASAENSHVNERRVGVHIGFGQHNQRGRGIEYRCDVHLDLIARGAEIWINDDPVPLNLEDIIPLDMIHPSYCRDEDVFSPEEFALESDCCGLEECKV